MPASSEKRLHCCTRINKADARCKRRLLWKLYLVRIDHRALSIRHNIPAIFAQLKQNNRITLISNATISQFDCTSSQSGPISTNPIDFLRKARTLSNITRMRPEGAGAPSP